MTTPLYRFEHKIIGRSGGTKAVGASAYRSGNGAKMGGSKSIAASAAYRTGDTLTDEKSGESFNYKNKFGILGSEIILPAGAPAWMADRQKLWNAVERSEKRKDSQLAREVLITLPYGLPHEQLQMMVRGFVRQEFVARGMVADVSFHLYGSPYKLGDEQLRDKLKEWNEKGLPFIMRDEAAQHEGVPHIMQDVGRKGQVIGYRLYQPHTHVMLTMRDIDAAAEHGFGLKNRMWNEHSHASAWRQKWANIGADALVASGLEVEAERYRAGYLDLDGQRQVALARGDVEWARECDREPQVKIGPVARKMESEGRESNAGNDNREIAALNAAYSEAVDNLEQTRAAKNEITAGIIAHIEGGQIMDVESPLPDRLRRQHEREALLWEEARTALPEQEDEHNVRRLLDKNRKAAEEAEKHRAELADVARRRAQSGDITDPHLRYAIAIGENYSARDPFDSLARAAASEYGMFNRGQQELREAAAKETDEDKRRVIDLRREIEAHDYMSVTSKRLAGISRAITMGDNDRARIDDARALAYQEQAKALREERETLQKEIHQREVQHVRTVMAEQGLGRSGTGGDGDEVQARRTSEAAHIESARRAAAELKAAAKPEHPVEPGRKEPVRLDEKEHEPRGHAGQEGAATAGGTIPGRVDAQQEQKTRAPDQTPAVSMAAPEEGAGGAKRNDQNRTSERGRYDILRATGQVAQPEDQSKAAAPDAAADNPAVDTNRRTTGDVSGEEAASIRHPERSTGTTGADTADTASNDARRAASRADHVGGQGSGKEQAARDEAETQARGDKARKDEAARDSSSTGQSAKDTSRADSADVERDNSKQTEKERSKAELRKIYMEAQTSDKFTMNDASKEPSQGRGGGRGR